MKVAVSTVLLTWIGYATTVELMAMLLPMVPLPTLPVTALEPFRIANEYGLFANMTPHRYEIEFQGSDDGKTWKPYLFRFKPQDPHERPRIYAPYQPRFDWNLWFASLGSWQDYPIVPLTEERLLSNDPDVLSLSSRKSISVASAEDGTGASFGSIGLVAAPEEKRERGVWWRRTLIGPYTPTLSKDDAGKFGIVDPAGLE